jgi:hypothetical protein
MAFAFFIIAQLTTRNYGRTLKLLQPAVCLVKDKNVRTVSLKSSESSAFFDITGHFDVTISSTIQSMSNFNS